MKKRPQKQEGDVLGISQSNPNVRVPVSGRRDAPVEGIEVGPSASGIGDVPQRGGATGADLGGLEGADVTPTPAPGIGPDDDE